MRTYDEYKRIVDDALPSALPDAKGYGAAVIEAARYSLLAGGKRLRAVLVLAGCDFMGGNVDNAVSAALAVECIHAYSLIHDDLPALDNDDLRRGQPSCHKKYGEATAILAGDGLNSHAFLLLSMGLRGDPDHADGHLAAMHTIAVAAGFLGMVIGQAADIALTSKNIDKKGLAFIHTNKTTAMIRASLLAGLYIGGASDRELINNFANYGAQIGLAFQARDDLLDATSTAQQLGKTPGKDKQANKASCVSLLGIEGTKSRVTMLSDAARESLAAYGERAAFFVKLAADLANRRD